MFGLEMFNFNLHDGYPEACVRALSKGLLREKDYENLVQCTNLEEFAV